MDGTRWYHYGRLASGHSPSAVSWRSHQNQRSYHRLAGFPPTFVLCTISSLQEQLIIRPVHRRMTVETLPRKSLPNSRQYPRTSDSGLFCAISRPSIWRCSPSPFFPTTTSTFDPFFLLENTRHASDRTRDCPGRSIRPRAGAVRRGSNAPIRRDRRTRLPHHPSSRILDTVARGRRLSAVLLDHPKFLSNPDGIFEKEELAECGLAGTRIRITNALLRIFCHKLFLGHVCQPGHWFPRRSNQVQTLQSLLFSPHFSFSL